MVYRYSALGTITMNIHTHAHVIITMVCPYTMSYSYSQSHIAGNSEAMCIIAHTILHMPEYINKSLFSVPLYI